MQWNFNCIYFLFLSFVLVLVSSSDPYLGIVGGRSVDITEAPWQAYLKIYQSEGEFSRVEECGGAIVNEKWILTAAHCSSGSNVNKIIVRVGSTYRDRGGQVIQVETTIVHGKYGSVNNPLDYDFSLLKLHEPIDIDNSTTKATSLPDPTDYIHSHSRCFVAGWGLTDQFDTKSIPKKLRGVDVSVVSHSYCQNDYDTVNITNRMICAASKRGDKDTCQGDSGGALMCKTDDGVLKQFGIVSASRECVSPDSPTIYGRVQSVRSWIRKYTGS